MGDENKQVRPLPQFKKGAKDAGVINPGFEQRNIVRIVDFKRIFASLGYDLKRNSVTGNIEVNGTEMTDVLHSKIRSEIHELDSEKTSDLSSPLRINDAINVISAESTYHPIKTYLDFCHSTFSSKEGGVGHPQDWLQRLVDCLETDDQAITYLYLKKWLIGAAKRVFEPHQNYTLVVKGPQGIGKSYLAEWLTSGVKKWFELPVNRYFQEGGIDPANKDHVSLLATKWIWAVDEIGGTMRKADRCALKEFLTKSEISIRRPYEKYENVWPRLCSVIASTNDDEFLDDPTGNRRFLVLDIQAIDRIYSSELMHHMHRSVDLESLWGQVMTWYRNGEEAFLTSDEIREQAKRNAKCEKEDPLESWLRNRYAPCDSNFICSETILAKMLEERLITVIERGGSMRLSDACKRLGFEKKQGGGARRLRGYGIKEITTVNNPRMHQNQ